MGSDRTLALIAKAAKKLERLDPDYSANVRRERRVRTYNKRRGEMRALARDFDQRFAKIIRSTEADTYFDARADLESIDTQDAMLVSLDKHISFSPAQAAPLPTHATRYEAKGLTKTIAEWSHHTGITEGTLRSRLQLGWDIERAVSTVPDRRRSSNPSGASCIPTLKVKRRSKEYTYQGQSKTIAQWAEVTGICAGTLVNRLRMGWSIEQAFTVGVGTVMGFRAHNRGWSATSSEGAGTSGAASRDIETKQTFFQGQES